MCKYIFKLKKKVRNLNGKNPLSNSTVIVVNINHEK